jgi:crotonobetainyl-CoA:carnitine CoA-transferase CaiB-like acyl-CoA transferase
MTAAAPLEGHLVVDLSRMLPGAVLARQLLDLGARLIRIEDPDGGDPMRQLPPFSGDVGLGFATFLRGAESVCLNLREPADADAVRALAGQADVVVESFRPGTMERWNLGAESLCEHNPKLVWCSLPAFAGHGAAASRVGHDLNLCALVGMLGQLSGGRVPGIQIADVTSGLLAASAIVAALLRRERTGLGTVIEQPLLVGPLPFMTWVWAEAAAGSGMVVDTLLGGRCPCYRTYPCGDGRRLALGAIEPKFWLGFLTLIGLAEHAAAGYDAGEDGAAAVQAITAKLAARPCADWVALAEDQGLPVTAVQDIGEAVADPAFDGLVEQTPMPDGTGLRSPGPWLPSVGRTPMGAAPRLGEHTEKVLAELGLTDS